jgi:hypothetical protein
VQFRQIGDTKTSALGLGSMPMSIEGRPEESRSIATIHAALDAGITLIDTADHPFIVAPAGPRRTPVGRGGCRDDRRPDLRSADPARARFHEPIVLRNSHAPVSSQFCRHRGCATLEHGRHPGSLAR